MKTRIRFLIVIGAILLVRGLVWAGGFGFDFNRAEGFFSLQHYQDCDSARAYFGYPDSTNNYEVVKLSPEELDSSYLFTTSLDLDSLGNHQVQTWYWPRGSVDSVQEPSFFYLANYGDLFAVGVPGAANLCRVYGYLISNGVAVKFARVTATLPKDTYDSCSNTIVFQRYKSTLTRGDSGRFSIDLTYSSCLSDEKYEFTFEKKGIPTITKKLLVPDSTTHYMKWKD